MKKNKVNVYRGHGRLTGRRKDGVHSIEVQAEGGGGAEGERSSEGEERRAGDRVRCANAAGAGAGFARPDQYRDSLRIDTIPKSLVVIGAGAVGVEFGSIFRSFGSEVTIVEYLPRLVPNEDEDVSKELARVFRKRGIESSCRRQGREGGEDQGRRKGDVHQLGRQAAW